MAIRRVLSLGRGNGSSRNSEGAFLRLKDGGIMFAYCRFTDETGHDDGDCDLYRLVSFDGGESWSEPELLIPASKYGVKNIMSVSLLRMKSGDLGVFFLIKNNDGTSTVMLSLSRDEGKSFYRDIPCTLSDRKAYYVVNNDRVERLKSGRLIIPLAYHRSGFNGHGRDYTDWRSICAFLLSDDEGESWREAADLVYPPFQNAGAGLQEPGVIEMGNRLFMYARTEKYCQYGSYSFDGGEHWTGAFPTVFSSPCSPMKIARDPFSGALVAVWNPIPNYLGRRIIPENGGRTPLCYAVSRDDGMSWSDITLIEDDPLSGYCYPALFFAGEGRLLVSYCAGGQGDGHCLTRTNISAIDLY
ncbi:MAG: exo-alpha-sialidase [Clostridia bacterium]|nr:exo-alpha-sialidase [Clostridia bacterium]